MEEMAATRGTMKRPMASIGAVVAALVLPLGISAPAMADDGSNLVVNGNFAEPEVQGESEAFVEAVPGWQGHPFNILNDDYVRPPAGSAPGTQSIDLNAGGQGYLRQLVTTTEPGMTYTLSFDLAGNPFGGPAVKTGDFYVNNVRAGSLDFDTTGKSGTDMGWVTKSYTFTASDPPTDILFLTTTTNSDAGPVITNVSLAAPSDADACCWLGIGEFCLLGTGAA